MIVEERSNVQADSLICLSKAAALLGVKYPTIRWYIQRFALQTVAFPLDPRIYLRSEDVEKIKRFREEVRLRHAS